MNSLYYILVDREVRAVESWEAVDEWRKTQKPDVPRATLQIARTVLEPKSEHPITVSTVFLPLDHGYGRGLPVVFETMAFGEGRPWDESQWRYTSQDAAEAGHEAIVAAIKDGRDPTLEDVGI